MSVNDLVVLYDSLPELFESRDLSVDFDDTFICLPVENPDSIDDVNLTLSQDFSSSDLEESLRFADVAQVDAPRLPQGVIDMLPTGGPGSPIVSWDANHFPPPDAFAFYLPFHHYYPQFWGIYLTIEGVNWIARELVRRSRGTVDFRTAVRAARIYLYYHEAFHHRVECLATRWEIITRKPLYRTAFDVMYRKTFLTSLCLEETLAEATALAECRKKFGNGSLLVALTSLVSSGLPGYAEGADVKQKFSQVRCEFTEQLHRECFPRLPKTDVTVWKSATHLFDGIANVKSRVNYLVSRSSPLAERAELRLRIGPKALIRKLKSLVGLNYVRSSGSHQIWITDAGARVTIPFHAHDLKVGTLNNIIKQAGVQLTLYEFCSR